MMHLRVEVLVLVLALVHGGCASVDPAAPAAPAIAMPPAWSVDDGTAPGRRVSAQRWWLRFDDALLARLVTQALQANTSVAGARAALRQARAQRDAAAAGLLPTVDGSASVQRGSAGGHSTGNSFRTGFDASWEPDLFGAQRSALEASDAAARARRAWNGRCGCRRAGRRTGQRCQAKGRREPGGWPSVSCCAPREVNHCRGGRGQRAIGAVRASM